MDTTHQPLILTLQLDADAQRFFNALRRAYFPPERNFLEAHCTLFHQLPGEEQASIEAFLAEACAGQAAFELQVGAPKRTGRGVAYPLDSPRLKHFHRRLQKQWWDRLSPQDQQGLHPHITVQNKVSAEKARALQAKLAADFQVTGMQAKGTGIQLWKYLGGPWALLATYKFGG